MLKCAALSVMCSGTDDRQSIINAVQVKLDRGLDFSGLDDVLVDMKLGPQVLELPCPAYFRDERSKVYALPCQHGILGTKHQTQA